MNITYHGTPKLYFETLDPTESYVPQEFGRDGFIHTTEGREALSIILTGLYKERREAFVVLHIDKERVASPIRYDDPAQIFPHIYGPLNRDAVLVVEDIARGPDGTFFSPVSTLTMALSSPSSLIPIEAV